MQKLTKVVALLLAGTLLGENVVFAQQVMSDPIPFLVTPREQQTQPAEKVSLAEVQHQARQDMQTLQSNEQLYGIIAGGASLGLVGTLALLVLEKNQKEALQEQLAAALRTEQELRTANTALKQENKGLSEQVAGLQRKTKEHNKLIKRLTDTRKRLKDLSDETRHMFLQAEDRNMQMTNWYTQQIAELRKSLRETNIFLENIERFGPAAVTDMTKYTAIFDASVPQETRLALREELIAEPWFQAMTKQEKKDFFSVVKYLYERPIANTSKETILGATAPVVQRFMQKQMPEPAQYMLAFYRSFLKKGKNLLVISTLLVGGASIANAAQANAQSNEMAQRIENNFDLFLNATAEELQTMEKDPVVYNTCLRNAAELHLVTTSDASVQQEVNETLRPVLPKQQLHQTLQRTHVVAR